MQTPAELDNLLLWLGPDTDAGALTYLEIRRRLVGLFRFRGSATPEELADETLDRTARAILKPGFVFEGNPMAYLRGVARNVHLESLRKSRSVNQERVQDLAEMAAQPDNSHVEALHICLDRCLARLPEDRRTLLLGYYQGEKSGKIDGRVRLAQHKGIELNALRIQVFRLRNTVRLCVERCTESGEIARRI